MIAKLSHRKRREEKEMLRMVVGLGNPASSVHSSYCVLIPRNPKKTLQNQQLVFKINHAHHFHFQYKTSATSFTFCRLHARRKESVASPAVVSDFDDDFDDDELDYVDKDGEEEEEEEFMPFGKMKKWLETKPGGFGGSKVYDTRIEDKLLEEIEQSRLAQAANINNLKYPNPTAPNRTLQQAKKDVRGIINIIPAVSGNKKTKDPVCKGFAFVDFKSEEDATRFVQQFSKKSIAFGKIQKQIKCEMKKSSSLSSAGSFPSDISKSDGMDDSFDDPLLMNSVTEGEKNADSKMDDSFFEETVSDIDESDDLDEELEDENVESVSKSDPSSYDSSEPRMEAATDSLSLKKQHKKQASKKKIVAKGGGKKVLKLDIPGSARRLEDKGEGGANRCVR
uniref:RRM domain-containing protein n=1 Tax=Salix viminalis TaxID=40686 RepID=A0A6N2NI18_SALVM